MVVGDKWTVVAVVLVVGAGATMVVAGAATVDWVTRTNGLVHLVALNDESAEVVTWVCGDVVRSAESMATMVAVTRGAAMTLVAGCRMMPTRSRRMAWRGGVNLIRLNTIRPRSTA